MKKLLVLCVLFAMSFSAVWAQSDDSNFISPFEDGKVLVEYNEKTGYKNVQLGAKDMLQEESDVLASADGEVVLLKKVYRGDKEVYTVIIEHDNGYQTKYSGLSDVDVQFEDEVSQRDVIGSSDNNKIDFVIIKDGNRLDNTGELIGY